MGNIRRQLTLFVDETNAGIIENIRQTFNPEQHAIIKSHVTLCREDEIEPIEMMIQNLANLQHDYLSINFGPVVRFSDGKGILMPAKGDNAAFHTLRKLVLKGIINNPGEHEPHITLMHPRNATCTDSIFDQVANRNLPAKLTFRKISLIQQEDRNPWHILNEFELHEPCDKYTAL